MPQDLIASPMHGAILLPLMLLLVCAEFVWHRRRGTQGYDLRETAATLGVLAGQILFRVADIAVALPLSTALASWRLFAIDGSDPVTLVVLFVAVDFTYYWFHRASHAVRWMWATHAVHHSSTHLNFLSAFRLGWTGAVSGGWLFLLPLVWIGFAPQAVLAMFAANLAYQYLLHTEMAPSLGPFEWLLNTPAHHRVHHATNASCIDRNFGGVLIVFDRLFGTFAAAPTQEALIYGIAGQTPVYNPARIALREWIALAGDLFGRKDGVSRWRTAFGPP